MSGFIMKSYRWFLVLICSFAFLDAKKLKGGSVDPVNLWDIIPENFKVCGTTERHFWEMVDSLGFLWAVMNNNSFRDVVRSLEELQLSQGSLTSKVDLLNNTLSGVSNNLSHLQQQPNSLLESMAVHTNKTDEMLNTLASVNLSVTQNMKYIGSELKKYNDTLTEAFDKNSKDQQRAFQNMSSLLTNTTEIQQTTNEKMNKYIQERYRNLTGQIKEMYSDFQQTRTDLAADINKLNQKTDSLISKLSEEISASDQKISDLHSQISLLDSDFKKFKSEIFSKLSEVDSKMQKTDEQIRTSVKESSQKVDGFRGDMMKHFMENKERDESQTAEILLLHKSFDELFKLFADTSEFQSTKIRKVYDHTVVKASIEDGNNYKLYAVLVLCFALGLFIGKRGFLNLNHQPQLNSNITPNHTSKNTLSNESPMPIYNHVTQGSKIDNEIGVTDAESPKLLIVGFSDMTIDRHLKCITALFPMIEEGTKSFVVKTPSDLRRIPNTPIYIVFVDFNERNVILEVPGLLQGELKNKTLQNLLSKGEVFVVYGNDDGSEGLPSHLLYNSHLTSIKTHDVLSALNQQERVMSISTRFNHRQQNRLREAVISL